MLAVGGHLKNTVAIAVGRDVFLSQHIGDLETLEARQAFEKAIADLCRLYSFKPEAVVCDLHPDYASTHWAEKSGLPVIRVQHHQAHVAACAAENNVRGPVPRNLLGWHRIRPRWRDLGRRVLPRRRQSLRARRTPAPLRAARRRCRSPRRLALGREPAV